MISLSYLVIVVSLDFCLVVRVHVQVALQRPQVLVAVAGSGDDLEADVAQGVKDDDARALQSDPVGRVPPGLLFHSFRKFALKFEKFTFLMPFQLVFQSCLFFPLSCVAYVKS